MPVKARPIEERFWEKVQKKGLNECWPWLGYRNALGYGQMRIGSMKDGTRCIRNANRISLEIVLGEEIPEDSVVCHTCDNPECVNPRHLFLGSHNDNVQDRVRKNRSAKGEGNGRSKLTESDVREIVARMRRGDPVTFIAKDYDVNSKVIWQIREGKTWVQVTGGVPTKSERMFRGGELASAAKMSDAKALEIRAEYAAGGITHRELAKKHGVSKTSIADLLSGRTFKHLHSV